MLKDVAYQMRTPEFWNAMDMIGGKSTYQLCGTFGDGKGPPAQSNAVTHGCVRSPSDTHATPAAHSPPDWHAPRSRLQ